MAEGTPPPALGQSGAKRAVREFPLVETPRSHRTRRESAPSPAQQSLHTLTTPTTGTKTVIPRSKPPRTVLKPQPRRPMADWLGLGNKARATRGRQCPIPGSETRPYIYNSDNLGTKAIISRVEPYNTVWKPQSHWPVADWPGIVYIYRTPERIRFHPRIKHLSNTLQFRQAGDESGDSPGRKRPARCGNSSTTGRSVIGWGSHLRPAHPGDDIFPSPGQKYFHISTTPTTRGRKRRLPGSIPPRKV